MSEALNDVTVTELAALKGVTIVDVREPDEYAAGHVPGAVNVPLSTVPEHLDAFDEGCYVVCQAGGRSAKAVAYLAQQGIPAHNVAGGTGAWISAGLPTE